MKAGMHLPDEPELTWEMSEDSKLANTLGRTE